MLARAILPSPGPRVLFIHEGDDVPLNEVTIGLQGFFLGSKNCTASIEPLQFVDEPPDSLGGYTCVRNHYVLFSY